jgi:PAS domain S-box-containing protein
MATAFKEKNQKGNRREQDYFTTVTILEHFSDAVFILSPALKIEYLNKTALDITGKKMDEILGKSMMNFLEFDKPLIPAASPENLLNHLLESNTSELEAYVSSNQYKTPVLASFGAVKNRQGEISYIIASAKDITIRRELEEELRYQNEQEKNDEKNKDLGKLAINVVHEISQPLTTIKLLSELSLKALKNKQIESLQSKLEQVIKLSDTISDTISSVRNFANNSEDFSFKPVQIETIINGAYRQLSYDFSENNITLNLISSENLPPVLANFMKLQQAFVILLSQFFHYLTLCGGAITAIVNNPNSKWLEIEFSFGKKNKEKPEVVKMTADYLTANERSVYREIINIGGYLYQYKSEEQLVYCIHLPVDKSVEREGLFDLIDMLHKDE